MQGDENEMSLTIALAGNPNSGKTTMFNRLTGASQRVGNWPGVTIDKKTGKIRDTEDTELVDLPGIYSLSPYSPEEIVTRNYLINDKPDGIINIVDATNLERNLFLTLQLLDTGIPTVIALNMMDAVEKVGDKIDVSKLSGMLGCPVVPVSALKGDGVDQLVKEVVKTAEGKAKPKPVRFDADIEEAISAAENALRGRVPDEYLRWYSVKLVENDKDVTKDNPQAVSDIADVIRNLENEMDDDADSIIADARYNRIGEIVEATVTKAKRDEKGTWSDRVDRIVTSRIWGIPIFIGVVALIFFGIIGYGDITGIGTWCTDWLNGFIEDPIQSTVADWCDANGVNAALSSLLVDGIIGGVGAVIGFLPQMLILFLALCILEDIGYMARIAFVMDRVFRHFGLSGKSLIPLLVGTGCGVPGVMASRAIESERDRKITAMTVTFIPCGAKLPVIAMITGALFPGHSALVATFAYLLGIVCVLISGIILKKWRSLSGTPAPFIMELPPYHVPSWMNVIKGTLDRGWAFVKKAGTIILISCILLWFLASYSTGLEFLGGNTTSGSILEAIGEVIWPIFAPLGWGDNWELSVGTITGLIAKENIIGTFGTLFGIEAGESGEGLEAVLSGILTPAAGLGFLAFNLICAPCFAAIGAMHRELGSWKFTGFAVLYQCLLAYSVALIIYSFGSLIAGTEVSIGSVIAAIVVLAVIVYLLWAKDPFHQLGGRDVYDAEEEMS